VESKIHPIAVVAVWLRARFTSRSQEVRFKTRSDAPDLHTQFESLLDQVWKSESDWRLWDRLDAAVKLDARQKKRLQSDRDLDQAA
jgi:hypothetical protein